jgi:phosphoenolpyruvate carboxykinase (diphosphate)
MDVQMRLGLTVDGQPESAERRQQRLRQVNLQLVASGLPATLDGDAEFSAIAGSAMESFRARARLLSEMRCPADARIEAFLHDHFHELDLPFKLQLPDRTVILGQHSIARELSLPASEDLYSTSLLTSYRVRNGVLHNPKNDRRTTQGTFHVTDRGDLPVPFDKFAVPRRTFALMFRHAVNPPADLLTIPFTAKALEPARSFVSLLIRPKVCPAVPGVCPEKSMEVRFFAPGSLVSNLDFVESIFGNGGDPFLARNDAALDVEHWTGHTGCVILAPHLVNLTKKELQLPRWEDATERQRRDGMCWKDENEKYNGGSAFKLTCRTQAGVIVTLLADNYYGYCKKEVKTQISYAANLYGNVEEEHSGGAIAFNSYSFGDEYQTDSRKVNGRTFADVTRDYGSVMDVKREGYAVDRKFPELIYIPENARASVIRQQIWWNKDGEERAIPLLPGKIYMTPSGFKLRMEKHPGAPSWRIIGTVGTGVFCHKPCTVSGGGKSEISKSLRDYMIYGPIFVADLQKDLDLVQRLAQRDFSDRWKPDSPNKPDYNTHKTRGILSAERSLGSVIKLLTPSSDYTDEYNRWLESLPNYIYPIVFIIKRFYQAEWGSDWRKYFGVDIINGFAGHELKYEGRRLVGTYLRVGLTPPQAWRTYKVRQDFAAAMKIQTEDDITASVVVPARQLSNLDPAYTSGPIARDSFKFAVNTRVSPVPAAR